MTDATLPPLPKMGRRIGRMLGEYARWAVYAHDEKLEGTDDERAKCLAKSVRYRRRLFAAIENWALDYGHAARAPLLQTIERLQSQRQQAIAAAADLHAMYQDARRRMYAAEAALVDGRAPLKEASSANEPLLSCHCFTERDKQLCRDKDWCVKSEAQADAAPAITREMANIAELRDAVVAMRLWPEEDKDAIPLEFLRIARQWRDVFGGKSRESGPHGTRNSARPASWPERVNSTC